MKGSWQYQGVNPSIASGCDLDPLSWVIGNVALKEDVLLSQRSVLRGDGENIKVGKGVVFLPRSTVHIATELLGAIIGDNSIIGRYSLIHACTLGKSVLVGDQAVIMDGSVIGNNCLVHANTLVPPGKTFPNNVVISGSPAKVVEKIDTDKILKYREELLNEQFFGNSILRANLIGGDPLAVLSLKPWIDYPIGKKTISNAAFVAPDSLIRGKVIIGDRVSIWFATVLSSISPGFIEVGEGTNIQDNTIIDAGKKVLKIGKRVTVGHNVRLGACRIGDDCLIGMGCTVEDGAIIEDGAFVGAKALILKDTIVKSNTIFAGRPAKFFRDVREDERTLFGKGQKGYEVFAKNYISDYKINFN